MSFDDCDRSRKGMYKTHSKALSRHLVFRQASLPVGQSLRQREWFGNEGAKRLAVAMMISKLRREGYRDSKMVSLQKGQPNDKLSTLAFLAFQVHLAPVPLGYNIVTER